MASVGTIDGANSGRPSSWLIAVRDYGAGLLLICAGFCLVFGVLFLPLILEQGLVLSTLGLVFLALVWLRVSSIRSVLERGEQVEATVTGFNVGFKPSQTWVKLSITSQGENRIVRKKMTTGPSSQLNKAGQKAMVVVDPKNPKHVLFRDDFYKPVH